MSLTQLTKTLRLRLEEAVETPTLLTLQRNDAAGAAALARSLKGRGLLDSGVLQILIQMQDDPSALETLLGDEL